MLDRKLSDLSGESIAVPHGTVEAKDRVLKRRRILPVGRRGFDQR